MRFERESVILGKLESTYGTDPTPTGGANAILVGNLKPFDLKSNNLPRDLVRGYMGGSEHIVGSNHGGLSFDVEFQSSGSMTTPTIPAWDSLLQACGFKAGVGTAGNRVEYDLVTDYSTLKSMAFYAHDSGVLDKLLGARGEVSIDLSVGKRPVFSFELLGLNGGKSAVSNATPTLTAWKKPLAVTDANTGAITLGCTYATGALSGGTEYVSAGATIKLGNKLAFSDLLGTATEPGQMVTIADRESVGTVQLELTAAQEVTFDAAVLAATTQSLGIVHGATAGLKMLVFLPNVQLINPKKSAIDGRRVMSYDMRILPSSGNDEIKLVAL